MQPMDLTGPIRWKELSNAMSNYREFNQIFESFSFFVT